MATIGAKLKTLGGPVGKTYGQITEVCGPAIRSRSVKFADIGPGTEYTWGNFFHTVTLKFNSKNVCRGVVRHRFPGLYVLAGVLVLLIGLAVADYILTHQPCSYNACTNVATRTLFDKWYCDEHYDEMYQYFAALGIA